MDHSLREEEALCDKVGTAGARLCLCNIGAPTEGGICFGIIAPCEGASCLHLWKPAGGTTEVSNNTDDVLHAAENCNQLGTAIC